MVSFIKGTAAVSLLEAPLGVESVVCELGVPGFWSVALRLTRTVSFINGTADVFLGRPVLDVSLVSGILDVPFFVGSWEGFSLAGMLSWFSVSLMREGIGLRLSIKRILKKPVKLPKS